MSLCLRPSVQYKQNMVSALTKRKSLSSSSESSTRVPVDIDSAPVDNIVGDQGAGVPEVLAPSQDEYKVDIEADVEAGLQAEGVGEVPPAAEEAGEEVWVHKP
jgi:hypothetical protein